MVKTTQIELCPRHSCLNHEAGKDWIGRQHHGNIATMTVFDNPLRQRNRVNQVLQFIEMMIGIMRKTLYQQGLCDTQLVFEQSKQALFITDTTIPLFSDQLANSVEHRAGKTPGLDLGRAISSEALNITGDKMFHLHPQQGTIKIKQNRLDRLAILSSLHFILHQEKALAGNKEKSQVAGSFFTTLRLLLAMPPVHSSGTTKLDCTTTGRLKV